MIFLFNYDYTLDEGGVETSDESNQQEVANNLARLSIEAVARLGGYQCECVRVCVWGGVWVGVRVWCGRWGCGMCVGWDVGVGVRVWDVCVGWGCTVFLACTIYCVVHLFIKPLAVCTYITLACTTLSSWQWGWLHSWEPRHQEGVGVSAHSIPHQKYLWATHKRGILRCILLVLSWSCSLTYSAYLYVYI